MTVVLICGGRNYGHVPFNTPPERRREIAERAARENFILREALDHLLRDRQTSSIITGGATGADACAHRWALDRRIPSKIVRAEWKKYGKAAGPIRNARMLEFKPDFVVAFPGGDGTADMIRQARAAGVEVLDYGAEVNG